MSISRRTALATGAAAITTAAITAPVAIKAGAAKAALAGEEAQVLAVFRQLEDGQRACVHMLTRSLARLPSDPALKARIDRGLALRREVAS